MQVLAETVSYLKHEQEHGLLYDVCMGFTSWKDLWSQGLGLGGGVK